MESEISKINFKDLYEYPGEWVNFYAGEIVSHDKSLKVADEQAERKLGHTKFSGAYVKPEWGRKICLPIYFKTVEVHPWRPLFDVEIGKTELNFFKKSMLVDSGADLSVISKDFGERIGLSLAENERIFSANGVGGGVLEYVQREVLFRVNESTIKAPVAWIQDDRYEEMIIGREVVFDEFDIEFKQAEELIIFKKR